MVYLFFHAWTCVDDDPIFAKNTRDDVYPIPHVPNKTYVRPRTMTHAEPSAKQNMMHCLIQTLTNSKTKTRSCSSSHPKIQSSALFENAERIQDSIQKRTTSRRCTDPKVQTLRHGVD